MKIDVSELLKEVGSEEKVEFNETVSYPEDGLNLAGPVKIKALLVNTGESILVKGALEVKEELVCSRCLKKFEYQHKISFEEQFAHRKKQPGIKANSETELKEEDFVFPIEPDNSIDLSELIRQNLIMALPIKALCSKNCKGLEGGLKDALKKVDPRLEKLKELYHAGTQKKNFQNQKKTKKS